MATSAPDQLTPRAREIVNAARELLEEEGIEALTRRIGQRLGIRARIPTRYAQTEAPRTSSVIRVCKGRPSDWDEQLSYA